ESATAKQLFEMKHRDDLRGVKLFADERRLLTWSYDKSARVWDTSSGKELLLLKHDEPVIGAMIFARDSRVMTRAGKDVRIWSLDDGKELVKLHHEATARAGGLSN